MNSVAAISFVEYEQLETKSSQAEHLGSKPSETLLEGMYGAGALVTSERGHQSYED